MTTQKWQKLELSQLGDFINGVNFNSQQMGSGFQLINVKDIFNDNARIDFNSLDLVDLEITPKLGNYLVKKDDIFFVRSSVKRAGIGLVSIAEKDDNNTVHCGFVIRLRLNNENVYPLFLIYLLRSPMYRSKLMNLSSGAAITNINQKALGSLLVTVPPLPTQEKIANILSKYDDLIENNRRRIELLEKSARLLYKEWFVYFRFPDHEHTPIIDGIPDGWERKTAFDVMDILNGGTPKTKISEYWNGDIPFYTPKDKTNTIYINETEKKITEYGLKNCSSKLYPKDTIFITARGTVGHLNLAQRDMAMNQSCYALVSKHPLNQYFLYFALNENVNQIQSRAVGAIFDAIIKDTFKIIPFLVPNHLLIDAYTNKICPIIFKIDNLIKQNQKLKQARDILLPRLMNGEINV
ncbi:MAG: restriction endonuclease subunit S [Crocosphaera sp.]